MHKLRSLSEEFNLFDMDRYLGSSIRFPVFINSIPKSGTNLLTRVIRFCPSIFRSLNRTLSLPRFDKNYIISCLHSTKPGRAQFAHLWYDSDIDDALVSVKFVKIFLYRNPVSIALSKYNYIKFIDTNHPEAVIIAKLSISDYLDLTLDCCPGQYDKYLNSLGFRSVDYPSVFQEFMGFEKWLQCSVSFSYESFFDYDRNELKKDTFFKLFGLFGYDDFESNSLFHSLNGHLISSKSKTLYKGPFDQSNKDYLLKYSDYVREKFGAYDFS